MRAATIAALMLAVFTLSVGFGVVLPGASFVLTAALAVLGFLLSLGLPHLLVLSRGHQRVVP